MRISGEQISTCWTSHRVLFQRLGKMYAVIHDEMLNSLSHLDAVTKSKVVLAYVEYQINWTEPSQDDLLVYSIFKAKQFDLDSTKSRAEVARENWKKWGRPRKDLSDSNLQKTKKTQENPTQTKQKPKETQKNQEKEKEKEKENIMCDIHTAADEKENKIRQTTATIKAERIWKLVLRHWNEKLWRNELRNAELTQRSYALDGVDLQQIDSLIDRYKWYKEKIDEKWLQGLFFFNLNEWILSDFLKNINRFEWDFDSVTWKLAKKDCTKQAIKELLKK